jgi:putative nucleotidyltransferase with HDIG domain
MLAQLKAAYKASLSVLANAIEARDRSTRSHVERVNAYAQAIARDLEWDNESRDALEFGAILHDIGKIAVREAVLCKTGRLNPDEWEEMRQHPEVGARMIERIPYLARAVPVVLHHHERWDGTGYPKGLLGEAIPLGARLLSVVDTYDAMTSNRPYRAAASPEDALNEIVHLVGVQFDPTMVEAFRRCWEQGALAKAAAQFSDA